MVDCCEAAAAVTDWGKRSKGFQMPANKKMVRFIMRMREFLGSGSIAEDN
jgi:hypothetical protein